MTKKIVYLSAHLDDAVYSCGGLIWEQVQSGKKVEIWTICAGKPPKNLKLGKQAIIAHKRWGTDIHTVKLRIKEDQKSCEILGVASFYFNILDGIYRQRENKTALLQEARDFTDSMPNSQLTIVNDIVKQIYEMIGSEEIIFFVPLALGRHIDHQLTRAIADQLAVEKQYYPDYPYMRWASDELDELIPDGFSDVNYPVSDKALEKWIESIVAHKSQFDDHFKDAQDIIEAMQSYRTLNNGARIWKKTK